jgi:polyisoprenoid-binding protein YceI
MQRAKSLPVLASLSVVAIAGFVHAQAPAQPEQPAQAQQAPAPPAERVFRVKDDGGSRVTFVSDAPLETINGVTSKVTGELHVNPADLRTVSGSVAVPIASIRTGIDLRDEHLRGANWLDAAHHANATFEITRIRGARALRPNREHRLRVEGRFTLHGVTRDVTAAATVKWLPINDEMRATPGITGDVIRVSATFSIELTDYNVSVPAIVRLKVSNEIAVTVNLRAVAE